MSKPLRRRAQRKTKINGNRVSIWVPDDEKDWANQLFDYAYSRGLSVSHLTRRLWKAWALNEEEARPKRR